MNRSALLLIPLFAACQAAPDARAQAGDAERAPCEGCGAFEAPANLGWSTRIAGPDEPGEPLTVSGVVYRPDGRTPAGGVILYLYHTNARGVLARGPEPPARARQVEGEPAGISDEGLLALRQPLRGFADDVQRAEAVDPEHQRDVFVADVAELVGRADA